MSFEYNKPRNLLKHSKELKLTPYETFSLLYELKRMTKWDELEIDTFVEEIIVYVPRDWRKRLSRQRRSRLIFPIQRPIISRSFDFVYGIPVKELKRVEPRILERNELNTTVMRTILERGISRQNRSYPRLMRAWGCDVLYEFTDLDYLVSVLLDKKDGEYFFMRFQRPHLLEWVEYLRKKRLEHLRRPYRIVRLKFF